MRSSGLTVKRDRHQTSSVRTKLRYLKHISCLVALFLTQLAHAQPPLEVLWVSEPADTYPIIAAFIDPNSGRVEVIFDDIDYNGPCNTDEYWSWYGQNGMPPSYGQVWGGCLNAPASLDHYVVSVTRMGYPRLDFLNTSTLTNHFYISYIYGTFEGLNTGPPGYGYASAYCVAADGADVYVGANSTSCAETNWTIFKLGGGAGWPACVPYSPLSLEASPDSILVLQYPRVTTLDKATGALGSTSHLFYGTITPNGKSCMSGDTLYWVCGVNGTLHVGKYLLGVGSLWEQVLPFTGPPAELLRDDHGRLWTSSGNNLIWVDTVTGVYSSATTIGNVRALDLYAGKLVVAGAGAAAMNFILYASIVP